MILYKISFVLLREKSIVFGPLFLGLLKMIEGRKKLPSNHNANLNTNNRADTTEDTQGFNSALKQSKSVLPFKTFMVVFGLINENSCREFFKFESVNRDTCFRDVNISSHLKKNDRWDSG